MTYIALAIALAGLVLCWIGIQRIIRRRLVSSIKFQLGGFGLLLLAASAFLVSTNLLIYQRLVFEAPVATILFKQKQPMLYEAELRQVDTLAQQFEMHGDEWQLDARVLKWHGIANVLGMDTYYRLHRLSGRYTSIDLERVKSRSVHAIGEQPEIDLWNLASDYEELSNWLVDAAYGSAVYLPMTDGAEYEVRIGQNGLVARPVNAAAKGAVSKWIGL